jgi:predicted DNA-binding protein YlxM (UPF0122 family)
MYERTSLIVAQALSPRLTTFTALAILAILKIHLQSPTMATQPAKSRNPKTSEWISKSEAARLRGVSRQAIWELVKRGRLTPSLMNGRAYLKRADVLNFEYGKRGPYSRVPAAEVIARAQLKKIDRARLKKLDSSKWLSLTEAAKALGITPQAVSDLVRRRRLRKLLIAEKTLVQRSSVEKFRSGQKARGRSGKKK